jgi:hypothetical protein
MSGFVVEVIREVGHYRLAIAIGVPVLGGLLALASSVMTPRGMAKGLITGAYLFLAALGGACLLFAVAGLIAGAPVDMVVPLFVPGVALAVIMGIFSPEVIRQYQHFEFRKLAAEIFRRS